jgi:hypothetical protein
MFTDADLKNLAAIQDSCLSVFQPLRDHCSQVTKAGTRLNSALQRSEAFLAGKVVMKLSMTGFSSPASKLLADRLAAGVELGDEFHILPLVAGIGVGRNFWILAFSINGVKVIPRHNGGACRGRFAHHHFRASSLPRAHSISLITTLKAGPRPDRQPVKPRPSDSGRLVFSSRSRN